MSFNRALVLLDVEDEHWRSKVYLAGFGYLTVWHNGKNTALHTLLKPPPPGFYVDHINENKWDCRKDNLRIVTRAQNSMNRSKFSGTYSSKYKGVMYRKDRGHFIAGLRVERKWIYLGSGSETYCAELYNAAAMTYFGEYAKLNEVVYETN